jgi:hypothetical protein
LWAAAAAAARIDGVPAVARTLGVGRDRLAARMARAEDTLAEKTAPAGFVEVDTRRLSSPGGGARVIFDADDGTKLEVELGDGIGIDVVALARAFWGRER